MYPSPPDMTNIDEASFSERLDPPWLEALLDGELEEVGFKAKPPCPEKGRRMHGE